MPRTLFSSPILNTLLAFLVTFTLLVSYGKTYFYRDPGSIFYDATHAYVKWYSHVREVEAGTFLALVNATWNGFQNGGTSGNLTMGNRMSAVYSPGNHAEGKKPSTCAVFMTMKREGEQYIELALASMLADLTRAERQDLHVAILFAHMDPTIHPSWQRPWLRQLVDEAFAYENFYNSSKSSNTEGPATSSASESLEYLSNLEKNNDYPFKGVSDYVMALEYCQALQTQWTAVFEGDVLFARSWYARLRTALEASVGKEEQSTKRAAMPQQATEGAATQSLGGAPPVGTRKSMSLVGKLFSRYKYEAPSTNPWLYIRLFNTETATGWAGRGLLSHNELLISLEVGLFVIAIGIFLRYTTSRLRHVLTFPVLALVAFLFVPFFITFFYAAGKANVLPPAPGLRAEGFGCCSQALVYPRPHVPGLIEQLKKEKQGQVDLMINAYARQTGLERRSLYPVMVQHRGLKSVRETTTEDARKVWSMAFENLDGKRLKREQKEGVYCLGWDDGTG